MRITPSLILLWTVVGCGSSSGPDSNVEVFKTPEQVRAERQAKLAAEWRRTAATIARAERRDVAITEADGLSILAAAGGAKRAVDLSDLKDRLNEAGANPTETGLAWLLGVLRPAVYSRDAFARFTELPVLGSISRVMSGAERRYRWLRVAIFAAGCAALVVGLGVILLFESQLISGLSHLRDLAGEML